MTPVHVNFIKNLTSRAIYNTNNGLINYKAFITHHLKQSICNVNSHSKEMNEKKKNQVVQNHVANLHISQNSVLAFT